MECLGKGCNDNREMYFLPVDAFVEGELHLVMDSIVSYPIQFLFLFVFLIFLSRK
jgi:hypothetical protein